MSGWLEPAIVIRVLSYIITHMFKSVIYFTYFVNTDRHLPNKKILKIYIF